MFEENTCRDDSHGATGAHALTAIAILKVVSKRYALLVIQDDIDDRDQGRCVVALEAQRQ